MLDGVRMVDEDGSVRTSIIVSCWYVEQEIRVVRTCLEQGLVATTKRGLHRSSNQYRK